MTYPIVQAEGLTSANTAGSNSPTIPTHQADDILVLSVTYWGPNSTAPGTDVDDVPTPSGWALLGSQVKYPASPNSDGVHANFWLRAAGSGTTVTVTRGANWDTLADTCFGARVYVIRGCTPTGTPYDAVGQSAAYTAANGNFVIVDVLGPERLIVQFTSSQDNQGLGPPSIGNWTEGVYDGDTAGTNCAFKTFYKGQSTSTGANATTASAPGQGSYAFTGVSFFPTITAVFPEGARVYHNTAQTINQSTWTELAFNVEMFDTNDIHDKVTNNGRITFETDGFFIFEGHVAWTLGAGDGYRGIRIKKNGTVVHADIEYDSSPSSIHFTHSTFFADRMAAGDYITCEVYHVGVATRDIRAEFQNTPHFVGTLASLQAEGTLAITLANVTLVGTATMTATSTGALAVTLANATLAGTAAITDVPAIGSLGITLDDVSADGLAEVTETALGSLAVTLDDATLLAAGQVDVAASAPVTLEHATLAGSGSIGVAADALLTLADTTVVATAGVTGGGPNGVLAVTLDSATLVGTGAVSGEAQAEPETGGYIVRRGPRKEDEMEEYAELLLEELL